MESEDSYSCQSNNASSEEDIIYIGDSDDDCFNDVLVLEPEENVPTGLICKEFRSGFVTELIERDGIGILFSRQTGLALFNVNDVFCNDKRVDFATMSGEQRRRTLSSEMGFVEIRFEGPEFKPIGHDCVLRQAGLLWIGRPPDHLQRYLRSDNHRLGLHKDRQKLLEKIETQNILNVDLVRTRGKVIGYFNDDLGVIECCDNPQNRRILVLFHVTDVYFFRSLFVQELQNECLHDRVPVGLNVFFDAVDVGKDLKGVGYYACAVFVGAWPQNPHPTLLPGGPGSHSTSYDSQTRDTFFYLRTGLRESIDRRIRLFEATCSIIQGPLDNLFIRPGRMIRSGLEYRFWHDENAPAIFRGTFAPRGPKKINSLFRKKTPQGEYSLFHQVKEEKVNKVEKL